MANTKDYTKFDKILNKANLIFALFVVFLPLTISLLDLTLGVLLHIDTLLIFFVIVWMIFYSVYFMQGGRASIKNLIKSPIFYILLSMLLWIILSCIFTNTFNSGVMVICGYIFAGISVFLLKKEHRIIVINCLIVMMSICVIMGFIDPHNAFMPGFLPDAYMYSMQFYNPNHTANAVAIILALVVGMIVTTKVVWQKCLYILSFILLTIHMFLNGSFGSLMAILLGMIIYFIYKWIVTKKLPVDLLLIICGFCMLSVIVDVVPFLKNAKFIEHGFFTECLAVFDNVFGTNLCWQISGLNTVPGADGYSRWELWSMALQYMGESPIFGKGIGFSRNDLRPHNAILYLCVDFGIVMGLLYIALFVMIIISTFKNRSKSQFTIPLLISIITYFVAGIFGNIKTQGFIYFVIVVAMILRDNKKIANNISE